MKKLYWMIGSVLVCIGFVCSIIFWKFQKEIKKNDPEYIVQFIKEHKEDKNISVAIQYNQQHWVELNTKEQLPLASTVKIIVAIAYAQQAADGRINPKEQVNLKELEAFYIPKTDGGAHKAWLAQLNLQGADSVPLSEVANGMIAYSSNANTEYLMHVLDFQIINDVLTQLNVEDHEPLYPIVSALYIPIHLMEEKNLTKKATLTALRKMDMVEYRERALAIHSNWIEHPLTIEEKTKAQKMLNMDFQKIWSDRLIRATTSDYISILEKLNGKNFFSAEVHKYLDPVLEQLMQNPRNQAWLKHAGQKGGSTAFVLTLAAYAEDKDGNQTEIAFFANNLNTMEQIKLSNSMNSFQLKFLTDDKFRKRLKEEFSEL
ncbi:serine hydrolase [Lysinibacillus sp. 1 U-2021]|uniref:serine hydrolase n=1 Tax=Lysinibacillus sp. 1 U-2021 TaxID=3039426 RepID=UPI0024814F60|nr:serine hydrolase [Lysinibacillus sp. 1 U-2021]WGT40367.1 serine hydrolase [Lysinibacillus sp. 1 U-2021]